MFKENAPGVLVVGTGVVMKGDIYAPELIFTSGQLEGVIQSKNIYVAQDGSIGGVVEGGQIDIAGKASQNIHATQELIIRSTGIVIGNITYGELTMEKGAKLSGTLYVAQSPSGALAGDYLTPQSNQLSTEQE